MADKTSTSEASGQAQRYDGPFSVELTKSANRNVDPMTINIDGDIAHVSNCGFAITDRGVEIIGGPDFIWQPTSVKRIRDGNQQVLWTNPSIR